MSPPKEKGGSNQSALRLASSKEGICDQAAPVNTNGAHGDILKQRAASKSEKIRATLRAKAEKFRSQTIKVDENWSIVRVDELNWQIRHKDQRVPYDKWSFGTFRGALLALPDIATGEEAKNGIADVVRCYENLCKAVLNALPERSAQ